MKIALSSDSSIDLTKELLEKYDIKIQPFTITMGDKNYIDGEISSDEIFEHVNKTGEIPKTSAVNQWQFEKHFENLLKNYDAIVHVSISKNASSAYQNAVKASEKFKNVVVIDSMNISTGVALACIYARTLIDEGNSLEDIANKLNARTKNIRTSFITDKLNYLHKGGRVSGIVLLASSLLKIHPKIYMKDGNTYSGTKYMGKLESVYDRYFEDVFKNRTQIDLSVGFVSYTSNKIKGLIEKAINVMKNIGFKNIFVTRTGATVSCHCGENCLGLLFIDDSKEAVY